MSARVRKAVFPVAGLGTRFLPATKASPKEMLPVVDKPLIQYAAEEAVAAGITDLIFVTGRTKRSIEDHFDKAYELESELEQGGKHALLAQARDTLPAGINCIYIRQAEPLGLGHAVLCARPVVGDEPFAVILADDLINGGKQGCLSQMVEIFEREQSSVIAVEEINRADTDKYGIVDISPIDERTSCIDAIVEKPAPAVAPSTLGVVGRYVLTPRIMELLATTGKGAGGEIQLTDGIAALLAEERVLSWRFHGRRYDCGNKLGYLEAAVEYGLEHAEVKDEFRAYLKGLDLA